MNNTKKSQFIVNNIRSAIDISYIKDIGPEDEADYKVMTEKIAKGMKALEEWQKKSYIELDGLTPLQYIYSLNELSDIIELMTLNEKNSGIMPTGFVERIKAFGDTHAYFGRIRTLIPETSGQHFGIIRTA